MHIDGVQLHEIESKMQLLSQPKIVGRDQRVVRQIKLSLFHARTLVFLAIMAMIVKAVYVIYVLNELTYDEGAFIMSQLVPVMVLVAIYCLFRLILSHLHLKHGERDFEVEVVEK